MATGRRGFLKAVAAAGAMAGSGLAAETRPAFPYLRTFRGRGLATISFPLGGVAAGSVGLGGRGQLRDWQIFNRAEYGRNISYTFPAIWASGAGLQRPVARILESRLMPPYQTAAGLSPSQVSGMERFEEATFQGEFPFARVAFKDREVPVAVELEAFSPFVPLDAEDSGLPVAVLRYRVRNTSAAAAKVSIAFSMQNPSVADASKAPSHPNVYRESGGVAGLFMTSPGVGAREPMAGSMAVAVMDRGDGRVTHLSGWPRAKWWASPTLFWDDFASDGMLGPDPALRSSVGSVCLQREIAAGAQAEFTFVIAWHFPNRTPAWCGWHAPKDGENTIIGNHYSTRFADAWAAAEYAASKLSTLEKPMRQFAAAMRETTLPAPVKEAAMSNLSTLVTPTAFRTADGRFRGFEGTNDLRGCCHGTCTHVWNYESATQFLFPSLARSMREAHFELADRMDGVMPIRINLPEGQQHDGTTATDGTMGQIMKAYLDFRLSGDREWLSAIWPRVKNAMEFAWVPGGWDGDQDGVTEGVQHNTYDVEFYGPNPMCGIYYLGGLRAAEEMARAMGDEAFAARCRGLFEKGRAWIDANLFNGRYYVQKIRPMKIEEIAKPLRSTGGAEDPEHPDFQVAEGCLVDQLVGQYVADFVGLGMLVDAAKVRKTLESIYAYNYKRSLYHHNSAQRIFALNDEAALVICDYSTSQRPKVPFPYFAEVMTGFEYSAAVLMLSHGMVSQGVECIENIRRRYDGERRNPWDEAECGHNYARAMASWSAIVALSGFSYDGPKGLVSVMPKMVPMKSFWSTATGWGTFAQAGGSTAIRVLYGKLPVSAVELKGAGRTSVRMAGRELKHSATAPGVAARVVKLDEAVVLAAGDELSVMA